MCSWMTARNRNASTSIARTTASILPPWSGAISTIFRPVRCAWCSRRRPTMKATITAIIRVSCRKPGGAHEGAVPVAVDCRTDTYTIDPDAIVQALTPRTKAVVPVHLYGLPADMDPILEIARARDLVVVEDAAQAHGARYRGRRVGGLGHAGC